MLCTVVTGEASLPCGIPKYCIDMKIAESGGGTQGMGILGLGDNSCESSEASRVWQNLSGVDKWGEPGYWGTGVLEQPG